jgi:hypothetical protein
MALAPSLPLFGVPSSLIKKSSISFCCVTLRPDWINAGAMVSLTLATALRTPCFWRVSRENRKGGYARTFSDIGVLVAIAELDGFVYTGGRARGHSSAVATYMHHCHTLSYLVGDKDLPFSV